MAHVGEEFALGAVGGFGGFFRCFELLLRLAPLLVFRYQRVVCSGQLGRARDNTHLKCVARTPHVVLSAFALCNVLDDADNTLELPLLSEDWKRTIPNPHNLAVRVAQSIFTLDN